MFLDEGILLTIPLNCNLDEIGSGLGHFFEVVLEQLDELAQREVSFLLEQIALYGKLVVHFDVAIVEELQAQLAEGEVISWDAGLSNEDFQQRRGELANGDLEISEGWRLHYASSHVPAQEGKEVPQGVISDEWSGKTTQKLEEIFEVPLNGLLE